MVNKFLAKPVSDNYAIMIVAAYHKTCTSLWYGYALVSFVRSTVFYC